MRLIPVAIFCCLSLLAAGAFAQLPTADADGTPRDTPGTGCGDGGRTRPDPRRRAPVALAPDLSVRRFLDNTGGGEAFVRRIETAQQRGGTRWRGANICEVRMEIAGARTGGRAEKDRRGQPRQGRRAVQSLERGLTSLSQQTFSAVGRSTGPGAVTQVRQADLPAAWRNITEAERRAAIEGADRTPSLASSRA